MKGKKCVNKKLWLEEKWTAATTTTTQKNVCGKYVVHSPYIVIVTMSKICRTYHLQEDRIYRQQLRRIKDEFFNRLSSFGRRYGIHRTNVSELHFIDIHFIGIGFILNSIKKIKSINKIYNYSDILIRVKCFFVQSFWI